MVYKWCLVPQCTNTSIRTPEKLFVNVPSNEKMRRKWLQLASRDPNEIVVKSSVFFCEDHFVMQKDMANYMQYKMGYSRNILMVDGVLPTKFDCQDHKKSLSPAGTSGVHRKKFDLNSEYEHTLQENQSIEENVPETFVEIKENVIPTTVDLESEELPHTHHSNGVAVPVATILSKAMELEGNCILCHKCLERCSLENILTDDGILDIFKFLIPNLDINALSSSKVCDNCLRRMYEAYNFKTCLTNSTKVDCDVRVMKEIENSEINTTCCFCKNLITLTSCMPLNVVINENDVKEALSDLIPNLSLRELDQNICTVCYSTVLNINDIFIILSTFKQHEQICNDDLNENKYNIVKEELLNNFEHEEDNQTINFDIKNNDIKIKEEINDEMSPTDEELSEIVIGHINYDEFICKNEEIDLKIEPSEEENIEEYYPVTKHEETISNQLFKTDFIKHQGTTKNSHTTQIHQCSFCEYQTKNKYCFKRHLVIHKVAAEVTWYKCPKCSFQTKHKQSFTSHLLVHESPDKIKMFHCDFCDYSTKFKANVRRHMLLHKDCDQTEMFQCSDCEYKSKFKPQLELHRIIHKKPEEIKWFDCPQCSFKTKRKCDLTRHKITHKNPDLMKLHRCPYCEFQTKFKYNLKPHMLVHKKENEIHWYKCSKCSYQFKRKYTLEQHMLLHKKPEEIELFKCQYCDFQTKRKYNLSGHMINHYELINR